MPQYYGVPYHPDRIAVCRETANNSHAVKNLLNNKKVSVIQELPLLIQFIKSKDVTLKNTYVKIFPVFFSYSEVFRAHVDITLHCIRMILSHPLFSQDRRLFSGWQDRFMELIRKMRKSYDKFPRPRVKNYATNEFQMISGTEFFDIIGYTELDLFNGFHLYLKQKKLHKYLYFFANLSFPEIMNLTKENIQFFERKVNVFPMTIGARSSILRKIDELRYRYIRLALLDERGCFIFISDVNFAIEELTEIFKTPIRGRTICQDENDLPEKIFKVLRSMTEALLHVLPGCVEANNACMKMIDLLMKAWSRHYFSDNEKQDFNIWRHQLTVCLTDRQLRI